MSRALALVLVLATLPVSAMAQPLQPPQPLAPDAMSRQQLRDEVARLRAVVQGRAVLPQRPSGCTSAETRVFDFWLGEWDVSPTGSTSGVTTAESSITLHDQGCVILEHWRPFGGGHGHSINGYDASDGKWHQTWIDSNGQRTEFVGATDAEGVLRFDVLGPPQQGQPLGARRMNFQRIDANTVRQWGDLSPESGGELVVEWDFTYRRRAGTR
ncbi:MAG: hypothetical protein ABL883_13395 [Terricaulis sp.]